MENSHDTAILGDKSKTTNQKDVSTSPVQLTPKAVVPRQLIRLKEVNNYSPSAKCSELTPSKPGKPSYRDSLIGHSEKSQPNILEIFVKSGRNKRKDALSPDSDDSNLPRSPKVRKMDQLQTSDQSLTTAGSVSDSPSILQPSLESISPESILIRNKIEAMTLQIKEVKTEQEPRFDNLERSLNSRFGEYESRMLTVENQMSEFLEQKVKGEMSSRRIISLTG